MQKNDFLRYSFPPSWDLLIDPLGDRVRVDFPVKVRLFVSRSPRDHTIIAGKIVPLARYHIEKITLNCMKSAVSLS